MSGCKFLNRRNSILMKNFECTENIFLIYSIYRYDLLYSTYLKISGNKMNRKALESI